MADRLRKILSREAILTAHEVFIEDHANPPFKYIKNKYALDVQKYSEIADMLINAAIATSKQFEEESSYNANDDLVHYYFDLFLASSSGIFGQSPDKTSAIVDGIHFKYFGQPSQKVMRSQVQLWDEKEKCFLNSIFTAFKEPDYAGLLSKFAFFCLSEDPIRATESLRLSTHILSLSEFIMPKIKMKINDIL
ncbi:MAG: hypothetical protein ISR95_03650 [Candidatus Marinimicrobia bacterium]|nr:hypothetical protein [Candidatus Neomarinimicrobiota bacterium]